MQENTKEKTDAYAGWFAKRLRDALEENGETQAGLLELLRQNGFPLIQSRLSHYMQGRRYPDPPILAELARAIGVSADYLLGLTEQRNPVAALEDMIARARGESKIDKIMEKLPVEQQREALRYAEYLLSRSKAAGVVANGNESEARQKIVDDIQATLDSVERHYGLDERRRLERLGRNKGGTSLTSP